jgi:hypothetical protein
LLPAELSARGVPEPRVLSASIAKALESVVEDRASDSPEAVFARLGTS